MKTEKKIILIVFLIAALLIGVVAVIANDQINFRNKTNSETDYTYAIPYHTVTYEVVGFAQSISVTYANQDGGTSQQSEASLPWTLKLYRMTSGDFLYVSAQNNGDYGYITVNIYLDGILVKTSYSSGAYVIATCSGTI